MPKYAIPHTAKPQNVKATFSVDFNTESDGKYTFNTTSNILQLEQNSVYFFESMEISGDIERNVFQSAIYINPQLFLKQRTGTATTNRSKIELARSLTFSQYSDGKEVDFFIKNNKLNNYLDGHLQGTLNQTVDLIGKDSITLNVSFNIYLMNDKLFSAYFRDSIKKSFSEKINRG